MKITQLGFIEKVGSEPIDDELLRSNCSKAGKFGHMLCGWCDICDLPIFICGHMKKNEEDEENKS